MLLINNLSFFRDENLIFENLNISLGNGQITQLRGKNGSGKTTFLKVILNLLSSKTGEIFWEGQNINKNIFNFYNQITYIADHNTSSRKLSVLDNINFWKEKDQLNYSKKFSKPAGYYNLVLIFLKFLFLKINFMKS